MSTLFYLPRQFVIDGAGSPRAGAKLNFYSAGTLTRQNTYSDNALSVANTNPVVADAAGVFGPIFLQNNVYRVILTDSDDVTLYDQDNVNDQAAGLGNTVLSKGGNYTVLTSDRGSFIEVSATATISLPAASDAGEGFSLAIFNTGTGIVTVDGDGAETVNNDATVILNPGEGIILSCDGNEWLGVRTWKFGNKVNSQAAPYTILTSDRGAVVVVTTAGTITLPTVADAGSGFAVMVVNTDSSDTTIDGNGSEQVNGGTDVVISAEGFAILVCSGTEWFALASPPTATTSRQGTVEVATLAEHKTGNDPFRSVSPTNLHNTIVSFTWTGTTRLTGSSGTSGWTVTNPSTGKYTITHTLGLSDVDALQLTPGLCRTTNGDAGTTIINRGANSFEVWIFVAGTLTDIEGSGAATVHGYLTE